MGGPGGVLSIGPGVTRRAAPAANTAATRAANGPIFCILASPTSFRYVAEPKRDGTCYTY